MFDIGIWVKIPKILGFSSKQQTDLYRTSLNLFETVQYKLSKIRNSFKGALDLSDAEIEAYSRYITVLSIQLLENWEEIVKISLQTLETEMKSILCEDVKGIKKIINCLGCCNRIAKECFDQGELKDEYDKREFGKTLESILDLKRTIMRKYFSKEL